MQLYKGLYKSYVYFRGLDISVIFPRSKHVPSADNASHSKLLSERAYLKQNTGAIICTEQISGTERLIGHVHEYPTMQHCGNPRHTQSMLAYMTLTEYFLKFQ